MYTLLEAKVIDGCSPGQLRGLLDEDLQAKVRAFRQNNPGTCPTLESLIQQAEVLADAEMEMLNEESAGHHDSALKKGQRLMALSSSISGVQLAAKDSKRAASSAAAESSGKDKAAAAKPGKVLATFSGPRQLNQYMAATCILHPN